VASVASAPVDRLGPAIEKHPRFPRRTNVEFMEVVAPDHIRLRVFERGTGETLACGTGACGAVAVGRRHGLLGEKVNVDLPGGRLIIEWAGPGQPIWLTGPTETVFQGSVDI
jgi:diaminopimelate epimerase